MVTQLSAVSQHAGSLSGGLEKIEVVRIRIAKSAGSLCAVVGEFRLADQILGGWFDASQDPFECQFVIEFQDGFVVRGQYCLLKTSARRPSLYRFLRRRLKDFNVGSPMPEGAACFA